VDRYCADILYDIEVASGLLHLPEDSKGSWVAMKEVL